MFKAWNKSNKTNCTVKKFQRANQLISNVNQDVSSGNGKRHFHPCSLSLSASSSPGYVVETNPVRIPISLCLVIMLIYICGGAVMFNRLEGWSLLEGGYFCFTSLGTIGFGDLMPVGKNAATATLEELSLCACSLYILAGMGLIAMCFNLVQEEVVRVVRVFGRTCGMSSGVVVGPIGGTGIPDAGIRRGTARSFRARSCFNRFRFSPEHFEPGHLYSFCNILYGDGVCFIWSAER